MSSQSGSRASRRPAFIRCTASGGFAAISWAIASALGISSSWGTRDDTSRMSYAVCASMMRPVNNNSAVRSRPTSCASRPMPATSQLRPRLTNSSPNFAFFEATRMSAITASSIPHPTAAPLTAAITGTFEFSSASAAGVMCGSARRPAEISAPADTMSCLTSSPEQNAGSAPVMTRQRAVVDRGAA